MKKTNIFGLVLILSTLLIGCAQPNMCADIPEVYTITCGDNVRVNKTQAMAGEMITVTADSVANKRFSAITLDGEEISRTTTATFEMPTKNVSIEAVYNQLYTISAIVPTGITVNKENAVAGEEVTVTIPSNTGNVVSVLVNGNTISGNSFNMPAGNVEITVSFGGDTPIELSVESTPIDFNCAGDPLRKLSDIDTNITELNYPIEYTFLRDSWEVNVDSLNISLSNANGSPYRPKSNCGLKWNSGKLKIDLESVS